MTDTPKGPLRGFADFLRSERVRLTKEWMKQVFGDEDLIEADKLTYEQLADHLPEILDGLCAALDAEDLEKAEPAIERNARMHGLVRWRQGYRIEELVRELDLFHQTLADALEAFADNESRFTRRHEKRARRLIAEALSFVTLTSIREVVSELHESRMQITRSVVHDLRNFLNAFSVALALIARAPAKAETALTLANRQAADMKQLVDQMVEYSVVLGDNNPLAAEPFDPRALFDELVTSCRPAIEAKGLCLKTAFDAGLVSVNSNRLKVKQVALNLLSNATKYTATGEIELAIGGAGEGYWSIRVSDTGIGIAPSDADRVFDEFERAAGDDIPGTGLGLAIVKELCRVLHGQIQFESREGSGTTFEIRFPLELGAVG
jgi:signal transduction histidine kinase